MNAWCFATKTGVNALMPQSNGESAYFVWLNRGKQSLVLDLARDDDKAVLAAMLAKADVFVQNLKPGAIAKLGFPLDAVAPRASAPRDLLDLRLRRGRPLRTRARPTTC